MTVVWYAGRRMAEADTERGRQRVAKILQVMPFSLQLGMELVEAGEGWVKVRLPFKKENTTAADALHGGAIASLIDTTGSMAAWTTSEIGNPRYFGSTVGMTVNYLSGVLSQDCLAEGRVLKRGKEIIYSDVRVTDAAGKLCAQGSVIYRIVDRGEA
jgi:uncharacterized protein (TIGR00369 family)